MSAAGRTFGGTVSLTKANVAQLLQYRIVLLLLWTKAGPESAALHGGVVGGSGRRRRGGI